MFASGLGLIVSSPRPLQQLRETSTGTPETRHLLVRSLIQSQQLVMLATGSPELDYHISLCACVDASRDDCVAFGLQVSGGALVFRDAQDLTDWDPDAESVQVPMEDGYYEVVVVGQRSQRHSEMILEVVTRPRSEPLPVAEMVHLYYRA